MWYAPNCAERSTGSHFEELLRDLNDSIRVFRRSLNRKKNGTILTYFNAMPIVQATTKMITVEEMYRRIVLAVPDGIWIVDLQGHTIFNNKRMAEILASDNESLSNQSCFDCVFPEDSSEAQRRFAQGVSGNREPFDFRLRRNDGSEIWVSISCGPVFDASGAVAGVIGLFAEITQRRLVEAQVRESEERFRNMANCAPVMLWMSGRDKLCDFFNQGWLAFTGRSLEQEVGNGWAEGVHPDDVTHCMQVYESSFDAHRSFEMEYRLRRHDGEYRWILDTGAPRFAPNGEFMGYVGTGVDITDKKQAEESNRHLAHLQHLATMGELTAAIAHELRQPLTAISLNVDAADSWLDLKTPDVRELKQVLRDIRSDIARAHDVIGRIRDFVLKRDAPSEPLDLNSVVAETLRLVAGEALRRRVQVRVELQRGIPSVIGNRTQLQQVLINLAINGMEGMATATTRQLTVRTMASGTDHVEVTVTDGGVGIGPEHMPRLFESFFTTKPDGMGLGLFLARSIVESNRGRIWADNNPAGGATFHFTVPVAQNQKTT
jgi:PAS domain S-box-containing protein